MKNGPSIVHSSWHHTCVIVKLLPGIMLYVLSYDLYRKEVFSIFKDDIRIALLKCIRNERDGVEQNRELLRECIMVFVNLGNELNQNDLTIYIEDFQTYLLKETKDYYRVAAEKWANSLSCPGILFLIFFWKSARKINGRFWWNFYLPDMLFLMEFGGHLGDRFLGKCFISMIGRFRWNLGAILCLSKCPFLGGKYLWVNDRSFSTDFSFPRSVVFDGILGTIFC